MNQQYEQSFRRDLFMRPDSPLMNTPVDPRVEKLMKNGGPNAVLQVIFDDAQVVHTTESISSWNKRPDGSTVHADLGRPNNAIPWQGLYFPDPATNNEVGLMIDAKRHGISLRVDSARLSIIGQGEDARWLLAEVNGNRIGHERYINRATRDWEYATISEVSALRLMSAVLRMAEAIPLGQFTDVRTPPTLPFGNTR